MSAPRYDLPLSVFEPEPHTLAVNEETYRQMREWCAKKKDGHRFVKGGPRVCIDCGFDLDD